MSQKLPESVIDKLPKKPNGKSPPAKRSDPVRTRKDKDFRLGVGIFFVLNIFMAICYWGFQFIFSTELYSSANSNNPVYNIYNIISTLLGFLPFMINIGLMVFFSLTNRGHIALGMLATFGTALAIVVCLGVLFLTVCFVGLSISGLGQ